MAGGHTEDGGARQGKGGKRGEGETRRRRERGGKNVTAVALLYSCHRMPRCRHNAS